MISRVLLLLLVAAVACAMVNTKDSKTQAGDRAWRSTQRDPTRGDVARPALSSYWKLERRYVAALKREGRLGAEVRRLRADLKGIRSARTLQAVGGSSLERDMLCIHGGEGAWDDPDAPYWGGLQMDREFMRTYGPEFLRAWGTADHWPQSVQIAVAIRAYLSGRGFAPWPNTSRACGLR